MCPPLMISPKKKKRCLIPLGLWPRNAYLPPPPIDRQMALQKIWRFKCRSPPPPPPPALSVFFFWDLRWVCEKSVQKCRKYQKRSSSKLLCPPRGLSQMWGGGGGWGIRPMPPLATEFSSVAMPVLSLSHFAGVGGGIRWWGQIIFFSPFPVIMHSCWIFWHSILPRTMPWPCATRSWMPSRRWERTWCWTPRPTWTRANATTSPTSSGIPCASASQLPLRQVRTFPCSPTGKKLRPWNPFSPTGREWWCYGSESV